MFWYHFQKCQNLRQFMRDSVSTLGFQTGFSIFDNFEHCFQRTQYTLLGACFSTLSLEQTLRTPWLKAQKQSPRHS